MSEGLAMRLGLFSDVHGNLLGLQTCLQVLKDEGAEKLVCLGDAIGYFPDGVKVLEKLRQEKVRCLLGNHESMLLGHIKLDPARDKVYRISELKSQLNSNILDWITGWQPFAEICTREQKTLCVHGSPWNTVDEYIHQDADLSIFCYLAYNSVLMGHTHRPFMVRLNKCLVVNVGSCGLPRDCGAFGSCCIYDTMLDNADILRFRLDPSLVLEYYPEVDFTVKECLFRNPSAKDVIGKVVR